METRLGELAREAVAEGRSDQPYVIYLTHFLMIIDISSAISPTWFVPNPAATLSTNKREQSEQLARQLDIHRLVGGLKVGTLIPCPDERTNTLTVRRLDHIQIR